MAAAVQVSGLAQIYVDFGNGSTLGSTYSLLGYTQDGVRIRDEAFWIDVHGDEYGGQEGPPIDIQYLGRVTKIHMELTKYDAQVASKIINRIWKDPLDTSGNVGKLMFAGLVPIPIKIIAGTTDRDAITQTTEYIYAVWRDPIEANKGTKYSTFVADVTCYLPPILTKDYALPINIAGSSS